MAMSLNTERYQDDNAVIDHTPSSAVTGGDIVAPGGGLITYADRDIAASEKGAVALTGLRKYKKDGSSGPTFSVGDTIYFDNSTEQAVAPGLALDGSADYEVAVCVEAAATGQDFVIGLPTQVLDRYNVIRPLVYEFDLSDEGDTNEHVLIPAWQNRHGLVVVQAYGIVTEQPVGDTEDQGEVTVEDSDDNALSVLITTDTTPDAVDDVIIGSNGLWGASSGDAVPKTVAAGKAVRGYVSQQTSDSGASVAGKLKAYLIVQPLV